MGNIEKEIKILNIDVFKILNKLEKVSTFKIFILMTYLKWKYCILNILIYY